MWEIISSVGSVLSGLSIVTAFILYRIEKRDNEIINIRKNLSSMKILVNEQSKLLRSNYSFVFAEDYFSNIFIEHCLSEICEYIEDNPQMMINDIKLNCKEIFNKLIDYPFMCTNQVHGECIKNIKAINSIISELQILPDLNIIVQLFLKEFDLLDDHLYKVLLSEEFVKDSVCVVLLKNIYNINNNELIKGALAQSFSCNSNLKLNKILNTIKVITMIFNYIIDDVFLFDDKKMRTFIKNQKARKNNVPIVSKQNESEKDNIRNILNEFKEYSIKFDNLEKCFEELGKIT